MNRFLGRSYNKFIHNIILLSGYKIHEENMNKYNFDTYQVLAHKNRVKECLINDIYNRKLKGIRLSQTLWGIYFIKIKLIEVGRLQYEYCNNNKGKYIKIHIPKGDKLLYNEVLNSIKNSKKEIKKYFEIENYEYYCESWLLSKDIANLLDSNSNIVKFQQLFDIIEGKDAVKDILNFVYGLQQINSYYDLPEKTSLQLKIKDLLIDGKEFHIGIGKLKKLYKKDNKNSKMEELKIDYKFNIEDFKVMEDIEHSYFPNDNITPAEEVLKWYQRNDLTCIGVRNSNNEVIASVNILPLNEKTFYDIYNNKMNEADVVSSQIERYENSKEYYLYLSSISINQNYRNKYRVITTLLKGCIDLYKVLIDRNIKIIKMMADASTEHGEKICKKLLKMDYIRDTSHNSKIYCIDENDFINSFDKIIRFLSE